MIAAPALGASGGEVSPTPTLAPLEDLNAIEKSVQVLVVSVSNLFNGAVFGAFFGAISGAWTRRSFHGALGEARVNALSWGGISAVYAGLQMASRVIRNKDDRINSVVGACGAGATFTAKSGPTAALQGCVSFAALSYLLDAIITPKEADLDTEKKDSDEAILRKR